MNLFSKSKPYKIVSGDAVNKTLSHAYLLVCQDGKNLRAFLKEIAKLISGNNQRVQRLIEEERYSDLKIIPSQAGGKIMVSDVKDITEDAYIKPIEQDFKIFIIDGLQNANPASQNKLLKILEEPPENVYFVLGTTNDYAVLPTVLSRVKRLDLFGFSESDIAEYLKEKFPFREDVLEISAISGGSLEKAEELAGEGTLKELSDRAMEIAFNLTPKTAVEFSKSLPTLCSADKFLPLLRLVFRDMLMLKLNCRDLITLGGNMQMLEKATMRYTERNLVLAQSAISEAERNLKFNANLSMTYETLFIRILEGR